MRHAGISFILWAFSLVAWADESVWKQLQAGGYVLLMRHAQTEPGTGDPPGFTIGDCRTQRNLSPEGRAQARRTGEAFRTRGVALREVRTSAWCRCVDTATLAFDNAVVWPALNSFFGAPGSREAQTEQVKEIVRTVQPPRNLMLVTHQVNITAMTGEFIAPGEIFLVRSRGKDGQLQVVGRLRVP
ncbi:histidine phosphatase family protein [Noviherbaspirillum sp. ST9]|uniref:histidine phosphatase family protein n=1 Tax=Noviherbaspirillum sp. ST9 TaxID=3401606 RepID=UPI003B589116